MSDNLPLDPALVRAEFPAFSEPSLAGWAFFENAGGSYMARQVFDRLSRYHVANKVQPYAPYPASRDAGAAMDLGYRRIAEALNVPVDWVHFGPSTSANTYTLGQALGGWLKPGDVVIVTNQDHEANTGAWRRLADRGIIIREWSVDPDTGRLDPAGIDALLDSRVRVVTMPHASNIVGEINPVAETARKARSVGAITIVDGVSYAPHGLPDLLELGCDIYLFSAYKVYGPHQGVMAIRPSLAAELPNQSHFFNTDQPRKKLVPAGPDHAQVAGMAGVADYLERVAEIADPAAKSNPFRRAHVAMRRQEEILLAPLLDYLRARNDLRLIGPADATLRAPTVAIATAEPGAVVAERLARHRVMASGGNFYAWRLMQALGIDPEHGVLRLSFTHYTTPDEVTQAIAALDAELR